MHPELLPWLAAAVAVAALGTGASWLFARVRARRLLGSPRAVGGARLAADLALVAALAALGAAALGPHLGTRLVRVAGSGVDLVLLVDTSRSMDAADVPPSRLVRARELARAVLERLGDDDRAALAAFADRGVLLAPLTPDKDALAELADALDSELIRPSGSALGAGVAAAVSAFEAASERPRAVLVLSDGEDPDGSGDLGTAAAQRERARVVTVALGSEEGAPLEGLADRESRPVLSRRHAARLAALAGATGGAAFTADRWGDVDVAALLGALRRDAALASGGTVERRVPASRTAPLAALAFALLALEWVGGPRALVRALRRPRAAAVAAALAALLGPAALAAGEDAIAWLEARLRERPGDAALLVTLGVARAESGRDEESARALRAAAVGAADPRDAALAYYDLGVLELRRERFSEARDAFLDALALAPEDEQARFNLEWALRALERQPPEQRQQSHERGEQQQPEPDPGSEDARAPAPPPQGPLPTPAPRPEAAQRFAPELSPDRVEKWLDAVEDDPSRGLRDSAREGRPRRSERARW
jgi:Ca-activated chloride channel family protein